MSRIVPGYVEYVTKFACILPSGKPNILIDGQFGSTGKGVIAQYVGIKNKLDIAISNASMNAGHTFYVNGNKYITRHLPISGIINKETSIYLLSNDLFKI